MPRLDIIFILLFLMVLILPTMCADIAQGQTKQELKQKENAGFSEMLTALKEIPHVSLNDCEEHQMFYPMIIILSISFFLTILFLGLSIKKENIFKW